MPSALRTTSSSSIAKPATLLQQKQKMTLSQTYYLAHSARGKLAKEAAKADHDLRLLVGHANLLDGLMLDLSQAEREQEGWFNQTVKAAAAPAPQSDKHVQWNALPAVTEDYEEDSDASDDEVEDAVATAQRVTFARSVSATTTAVDDEDDDMAEDDEHEEPELALRRTPSHSSPPELMDESEESDSDSDSDLPHSPPAPSVEVFPAANQKHLQHDAHDAFYEDGFYLPQRQSVAVF